MQFRSLLTALAATAMLLAFSGAALAFDGVRHEDNARVSMMTTTNGYNHHGGGHWGGGHGGCGY